MKDTFDALFSPLGLDQLGVAICVALIATLLVAGAAHRGIKWLAQRARKTRNLYEEAAFHSARQPLVWLIYLSGLCWAGELASPVAEWVPSSFWDRLWALGTTFLVTLFALRFIRFIEAGLITAEYRASADPTTASAISKLLCMLVVGVAILMAADSLGISIDGLLALGGVGGIAIGFAARDLLANFFGGLMVYLDRPFVVGDWIRSSEKEIEGTVEEIGWRQTRIRTFDQRPLYVPNASFSTITVENPSRMRNRRIHETIGLRYDDLAVLPLVLKDVRAMFETHEAIDHRRILMVNFNAFGASSLDFFVYAFTKTTAWAEYHAIKEDVLLKIAAIIADHGAEVAFPTRSLQWQDASVSMPTALFSGSATAASGGAKPPAADSREQSA